MEVKTGFVGESHNFMYLFYLLVRHIGKVHKLIIIISKRKKFGPLTIPMFIFI